MNPNHTEILLVLDASGSMSHLEQESIGSINNFIEDQKKLPGSAALTIIKFSDFNHIKTIIDAKDLKDIKPLTVDDYKCDGMTALCDAACLAIDNLGVRLSNMDESNRPGLVIVAILTDGQENNSQKFKKEDLASRIKEQTDKYNWQFFFLAANIDAVKTAESYAIKGSNAMSFNASSAGIKSVYDTLSASTRSLRSK
jgi:uncharacterized protein YegL